MSAELIFIYDTHCPWSYAATELVAAVSSSLPNISIQLMHAGYYDGDNKVAKNTLEEVRNLSDVPFGDAYFERADETKDSTLGANLMAWAQNKSSHSAFNLLQSIQKAHFIDGKDLEDRMDVEDIVSQLKLSPPGKALKVDSFTKDAEFSVHEVYELQDIIGTSAIPALLLVNDDDLVLLNHNLYLGNPEHFVDAVKRELS